MVPQCPGHGGVVVCNVAGHEADELHRARHLPVPRHVEGVQVGVRAEAAQLQVHLLGVRAGAGDHVGGDAGPVLSRAVNGHSRRFKVPRIPENAPTRTIAKVRWQLYLPPVPHRDEHAAVVGLAAGHLAADAEVNLVPSEVVEPLALGGSVTEVTR